MDRLGHRLTGLTLMCLAQMSAFLMLAFAPDASSLATPIIAHILVGVSYAYIPTARSKFLNFLLC